LKLEGVKAGLVFEIGAGVLDELQHVTRSRVASHGGLEQTDEVIEMLERSF